ARGVGARACLQRGFPGLEVEGLSGCQQFLVVSRHGRLRRGVMTATSVTDPRGLVDGPTAQESARLPQVVPKLTILFGPSAAVARPAGVTWQTHRTARLRGRSPRFVA